MHNDRLYVPNGFQKSERLWGLGRKWTKTALKILKTNPVQKNQKGSEKQSGEGSGSRPYGHPSVNLVYQDAQNRDASLTNERKANVTGKIRMQ